MTLAQIVLTPTAARHFREIMRYTKREHPENYDTYKKLIQTGIAAIPANHRNAADKREHRKAGTDFELQHIQHYYAVYKIIDGDTFAVAALLRHERDIPARLKELQSMTSHEIAAIRRAGGVGKI